MWCLSGLAGGSARARTVSRGRWGGGVGNGQLAAAAACAMRGCALLLGRRGRLAGESFKLGPSRRQVRVRRAAARAAAAVEHQVAVGSSGGAGAGEMPSARRARQPLADDASAARPPSSQAFSQQTPARCAAAGARGPRANRRHSVWCVWGARGRWRGSGLVPAGGAVGWSRVCERDAADGAHSSRAAAAAGGGAALSTSCRLLAAGCWPCGTDDALCLQHAAHAACRTSRAVSCPVHRASGPTGCGQLATQVQCERLSAGAAGASQAAGMPAADR